MRWLRSEEMDYISFIVNEDAAHECIAKLGDLGVVQFDDLNHELTPFQRRYVSYVKRCDEMERKLRYFEGELAKFNIKPQNPGTIAAFIKQNADNRTGSKDTAERALTILERILEEKESELLQLNSIHEKLTREFNERKELQEVLSKVGEYFAVDIPDFSLQGSRAISRVNSRVSGVNNGLSPLLQDSSSMLPQDERLVRFRNITGVVPSEVRLRFERMVFRVTKGNVYMRLSEIAEPLKDPSTGGEVMKHAFVIVFQSEYLENMLRSICSAFQARLYTTPPANDRQAIGDLMRSIHAELSQSNHILRKNRERCVALCRELAENFQVWKWTVMQQKATYHTLNLFKADVSGMLRGEGWVLSRSLDDVQYEVTKAHSTADKSMPSLVNLVPKPWPVPPTHFETNKFTAAFQDFVDTYGIARYREINPAVFTAVTFPFLFGVMYGDIGHGMCLLIAGLYMVLTEKRMESGIGEMLSSLYRGRYMITMMGAFSVYAGLVYNDVFAVSLNLFGSRYRYPDECYEQHPKNIDCAGKPIHDVKPYNPADPANVYPFGLDPIWKTTTNELLFFNSFKMKISVIFGVIQMVFGICLRGANALYFGNVIDFCCEFVPMLMFSVALFVYMVFMIFLKWSVDWTLVGNGNCTRIDSDGTPMCRPPPLINSLINIALKPGTVDEPLYDGQANVQLVLLGIAGATIPLLLFVKPFILRWMHSRGKEIPGHHGHGEFAFSEVFIHQAIETIEFVLGMVSNTASYLRLWALSLAHSELAMVFWEKAMVSGIKSENPFFIFIAFAIFAAVTTGVLLLMDVLECFLHALRLHWVEFQNKFYGADGYAFAPYSFKLVLSAESL